MAKKKARTGRGGRRKKAAGRRRGAGALRGVPTMDLRAELERRSQDLGKLEARRDELMSQVEEVEAEIATINAALGAGRRHRGARRGRPPGRRKKGRRTGRRPGRPAGSAKRGARAGTGRKRPRNPESLEVALAKVLKGKTMGVSEVADAVQKAGYRTSSPNFRTIVNQALIRSELIKKTGRGAYTAA